MRTQGPVVEREESILIRKARLSAMEEMKRGVQS